MASAVEQRESGEGDSLGLLGASASRRFVVYTDNFAQQPRDVLMAAIPPQTPHYDPRLQAALATEYVLIARTAPLTTTMDILYKTPDQLQEAGSFNGWTVDVRFENVRENVGRSLPDFDARGRPINEGVLVGPHIYRPALTPEEPTHYAASPQTGDRIGLVQLGARTVEPPIHVTPQPRERSRMVLEFSKTAPRMSLGTFGALGQMRNRVNLKSWKGFPSRTLMFTDCVIGEQVSMASGYSEFTYPTRLQFTQEPETWTPLELAELYEDESFGGIASEVIPNVEGPPAVLVNKYPWYYTFNPDHVFLIAGGSVTGTSQPIQPTVRA